MGFSVGKKHRLIFQHGYSNTVYGTREQFSLSFLLLYKLTCTIRSPLYCSQVARSQGVATIHRSHCISYLASLLVLTWPQLWRCRGPHSRAAAHRGGRGGGRRLRVVRLGHVLLPVIWRYPKQLHRDNGLLLGVLEDDIILGVRGGVAYDGGAKYFGHAGEWHLVGVAP